jgi:hypothetical protein
VPEVKKKGKGSVQLRDNYNGFYQFRGRRGFDSLDQFSAIYDSVWEPISCYSHAEALHSKNGYKGASRTLDEYPELTGCASERLRKLKNKGYQISRYIE